MIVTVQLVGLLAASAGFREKSLEMEDAATVGSLFRMLELPVSGVWTRAKVNGRIKSDKYLLHDGDTVLFFPMGGGG